MDDKLSCLTMQELWQLFPIILVHFNDKWKSVYQNEAKRLSDKLNNEKIIINHIGSTSINGIYAKPIIDILVEIPYDESIDIIYEKIISCGYRCMSKIKDRISFNKRYGINGFEKNVYHLHLRFYNDNDELYFKQYLIDNPDVAKCYETLKLSISKFYKYDRDGYTNAKTEFVKKYTDWGKAIYKNKFQR